MRPRVRFPVEPRRERASVHHVHVVDPEHDSTPDGPLARADCVELNVEVAGADPEAGERMGASVIDAPSVTRESASAPDVVLAPAHRGLSASPAATAAAHAARIGLGSTRSRTLSNAGG